MSPMDESQLRIAGAEKAIMTLAAHIEPAAVQASMQALLAQLAHSMSDDERLTILCALELLDNGA